MDTNISQDRKNTQIENALRVLSDMEILVTAEDRKAAAGELQISIRTVQRYLKKEGGYDADTAARLVAFFRKRIKERDKLIGC